MEINSKKKGKTPLVASIEGEKESIFNYLIENNANADIVDRNNETALHHALRIQNMNFLRGVMKLKPNISIKNKNKQIPLEIANTPQKQIILSPLSAHNSFVQDNHQ